MYSMYENVWVSVCTSACTYICVSVYVLVCICMWSFKLSTYIRTYPMCLSVCMCAMQPSPSTVLVCPATQDPPDHVLSVCLCVCRPTATSLGRCTREFTACQRLSPQLWTSRTMSRGSEPWRAGWGVEWCGVRVKCEVWRGWCVDVQGDMWDVKCSCVGWGVERCGVRVRCGVVWCEDEMWSGVVWGWGVGCRGGGVRVCMVTCEMWSAGVMLKFFLYFGKMSAVTLWIFPLWRLENAVCMLNTLLAPQWSSPMHYSMHSGGVFLHLFYIACLV